MADEQDNIDVNVRFKDADGAAAKLDEVKDGLAEVDSEAKKAKTSTEQVDDGFKNLTQQGTQLAQRVQGVASATQQLVSAMGSTDRTAGLVASVAGATAQFAAMGSMLGPGGTVIGGLAGLVTGLMSAYTATNDLAAATRAARTEIEALADARISDRDRAEFDAEIESGAIGADRSTSMIERAREVTRIEGERALAEASEHRDRVAEIRATYEGAGRAVPEGVAAALNREAAAIRENVEALSERNQTLREELQRRADLDAIGDGVVTTRSGGGAAAEDAVTEVDFNERYREERARVMTERLEMTRDILAEELDAELAHQAAVEEVWREAADREIELQAEVNEALAEAEEDYQERLAEGRQAQKDAETDLLQSQLEEREDINKEMMGLLSNTTSLLGDAIKDIATGEKTAEEAFKGLAAAFLEMLSEYATLKAATEFADAASSFARYDYAGGAAHIGAGVAFTAVAVATGIGAAAITSAPQAPARPEAGQQPAESGRGGDLVINWNGPVITAGTRAELGREINSLAAEGASI